MIKLTKKNKNGLVFIFKEKHSNFFFYCQTQEEVNNMFLKIVLKRFEDGFYYHFQTSDEKMLQEKILLLENESKNHESMPIVLEGFKKQIKVLKNELSWSVDSRIMEGLLKMALDGNAKAANELCDIRQGYQYEEFEYDEAETI